MSLPIGYDQTISQISCYKPYLRYICTCDDGVFFLVGFVSYGFGRRLVGGDQTPLMESLHQRRLISAGKNKESMDSVDVWQRSNAFDGRSNAFDDNAFDAVTSSKAFDFCWKKTSKVRLLWAYGAGFGCRISPHPEPRYQYFPREYSRLLNHVSALGR